MRERDWENALQGKHLQAEFVVETPKKHISSPFIVEVSSGGE